MAAIFPRVAREADRGQLGVGGRGVAGEDNVAQVPGDENGFDATQEREVGRQQKRWDEDRQRAGPNFGGEGAAEILLSELIEREAETGRAFAGKKRNDGRSVRAACHAGCESWSPVVGHPSVGGLIEGQDVADDFGWGGRLGEGEGML